MLEIERFVARDDPRAAARLVDKLIDRGDALAEHPERGRRLPELPESGLRELIVGNYRLVYRRTPKAVPASLTQYQYPVQEEVSLHGFVAKMRSFRESFSASC